MADQNGKTIIKDNAGTINIHNSNDTKILEKLIEQNRQSNEIAEKFSKILQDTMNFAKQEIEKQSSSKGKRK